MKATVPFVLIPRTAPLSVWTTVGSSKLKRSPASSRPEALAASAGATKSARATDTMARRTTTGLHLIPCILVRLVRLAAPGPAPRRPAQSTGVLISATRTMPRWSLGSVSESEYKRWTLEIRVRERAKKNWRVEGKKRVLRAIHDEEDGGWRGMPGRGRASKCAFKMSQELYGKESYKYTSPIRSATVAESLPVPTAVRPASI